MQYLRVPQGGAAPELEDAESARQTRVIVVIAGHHLDLDVPELPDLQQPFELTYAPDAESGRGLILVEAYADRWGVDDGPAPCKTTWAELDLGHVS
ncbi:hypothetical protein Save01_05478 [Streptomyces avermitilis]|uniref:Histidine kinase/HSP90-like ATPase domain-containing protein n=1 Tax=Streptomyces avermitilis TaxID=33903 RepID=A0A4D4M2X4_STRAX|nr:hypothetical protein SAVMC3_67990 [Streptomyces avermitilis]GDY66182.1 hypothetical protein SAV14893_055750 [Streptomyces avermitilis]GDY82685.1 hypothetical protein SAVCW2_18840 [Streptomyces avermitilis]